ncbi:MAG TPA: ABC transporter substrate-binding protein [Sphingomonas sp.]
MNRALPLLPLALLASACGRPAESGPIGVTVIGPPIGDTASIAPDRGPLGPGAAVLVGATAQGLVRFDAGGQIVAGLAARWIVSDDGRSLIFRLPDPPAAGPGAITAEAVARRLRAAIAPDSRNPLKPLLGAIADVSAVTPQVIDIELNAPRPNLLDLLAQPALAIPARDAGGPFAVAARAPGLLTLRERIDPARDPDRADLKPAIIRLSTSTAGRAVARFIAGRVALVLGGGFADLAVARGAALPRGALRFDPASGLFGLAFAAADTGLTSQAPARRALAMAIDRGRIGKLLAIQGWVPQTGIVPLGTPEIAAPARPDWSAMPLADRRSEARRVIAGLAMRDHPLTPLRVAMPAGPGARLLFAAIAADWRAIGVPAIAVSAGAPADLRLIDAVAPVDNAAFYLRSFACERGVACATDADRALIAARAAPSLARRATLFVKADARMAQVTPFIALGPPVRWSLVAPGLDLYRDSPRAIHPLIELRTPSGR